MFHGRLICLIVTRLRASLIDPFGHTRLSRSTLLCTMRREEVKRWKWQVAVLKEIYMGMAKDGRPSTQHDSTYGNCLQKTFHCLQFQSLTWTQDVRLSSTFNPQDVHSVGVCRMRCLRFLFWYALQTSAGCCRAVTWLNIQIPLILWKSYVAKRRPSDFVESLDHN